MTVGCGMLADKMCQYFTQLRTDVLKVKLEGNERIPFFKFKVCNSVHHRTIQINHQPDATIFQFIILTFIYSSTCFGRSPAHHQVLNDCSSSILFYFHIMVIAVFVVGPTRPRTQHGYHHDM